MKNTYKIIEAHSGTSIEQIEKAKRHYRKHSKYTGEITIKFTDINYCIVARYYACRGQEVCDTPCNIN